MASPRYRCNLLLQHYLCNIIKKAPAWVLFLFGGVFLSCYSAALL